MSFSLSRHILARFLAGDGRTSVVKCKLRLFCWLGAFSDNVRWDSLFFSQALQTGSGALAKWLEQSVNFDLRFRKSFWCDVQLSENIGRAVRHLLTE